MAMNRFFPFLALCLFFVSCEELDRFFPTTDQKKEVTYSFDCLDSAVSGGAVNRTLGKAGELIRDLAVSKSSISDSMQTLYGAAFHKDALESGTFKILQDGRTQARLTEMMNELLAQRENPSDIRYAIYLLTDTTVNAFTFGGRIYITQAMLEQTRNRPSLLYFIIGHEIGHSEMGHIRETIQEMQLADKVFGGQRGIAFFQIKKLLAASFNQRNELEADYYGINLINNMGLDLCTSVEFWRELASQENSYSEVEDFFRSHPFSNLRAQCLSNHIKSNFQKDCGIINDNPMLPQEP